MIAILWTLSISFRFIDVHYRLKGPDVERYGDNAFCIFALRNIDVLFWQDREKFMNSTYEKIMMCDLKDEPLLTLLRLDISHMEVIKAHFGVINHIASREEPHITGLEGLCVQLAKMIYTLYAIPLLILQFMTLFFVSSMLAFMDYAIFIN